jgi:hypothetical protein
MRDIFQIGDRVRFTAEAKSLNGIFDKKYHIVSRILSFGAIVFLDSDRIKVNGKLIQKVE